MLTMSHYEEEEKLNGRSYTSDMISFRNQFWMRQIIVGGP